MPLVLLKLYNKILPRNRASETDQSNGVIRHLYFGGFAPIQRTDQEIGRWILVVHRQILARRLERRLGGAPRTLKSVSFENVHAVDCANEHIAGGQIHNSCYDVENPNSSTAPMHGLDSACETFQASNVVDNQYPNGTTNSVGSTQGSTAYTKVLP